MTVSTLAAYPTGTFAPGFNQLQEFDEQELALVSMHYQKLVATAPHNAKKAQAYDAKRLARQLGIAVPPNFRNVETVVGWPGTVVDTLEERSNLEQILVPGGADLGLQEILDDNHYFIEAGGVHVDSLIHGIGFGIVGRGVLDDGEPDVLITFESPLTTTADYSRRLRRNTSAASFAFDQVGTPKEVTLYTLNQTIRATRSFGGPWTVVDRDQHDQNRCPVVGFPNRRRPSDTSGRSEITRAVLGYTDHAIRTLLGMDIARDFYSAPQRYILGADESAFQDANGNAKGAWETYIGRVLALTRDENGDLPQVGTFAAASPQPYADGLRVLAQLLAAEAALPVSYLGIVTDNPASADAIREAAARLISRAGRRNDLWGVQHGEVGYLALLTRDGEVPPEAKRLLSVWADPATPTPSAQADRAVKLTQGDRPILPPETDVARELAGLTIQQRDRLRDEERRTAGRATSTALATAAQTALADPTVAALAARQRQGPAA